jgi:hypothetical protein
LCSLRNVIEEECEKFCSLSRKSAYFFPTSCLSGNVSAALSQARSPHRKFVLPVQFLIRAKSQGKKSLVLEVIKKRDKPCWRNLLLGIRRKL